MVLENQEGWADRGSQARFKLASIKISEPPRSGLVQRDLYRKTVQSFYPEDPFCIIRRFDETRCTDYSPIIEQLVP